LSDQRPAAQAVVVRQALFRDLPVGQHRAHGSPRADDECGLLVSRQHGFDLVLNFAVGALQRMG
jgi:hypothetical protein